MLIKNLTNQTLILDGYAIGPQGQYDLAGQPGALLWSAYKSGLVSLPSGFVLFNNNGEILVFPVSPGTQNAIESLLGYVPADAAHTVISLNGRQGNVVLNAQDIIAAIGETAPASGVSTPFNVGYAFYPDNAVSFGQLQSYIGPEMQPMGLDSALWATTYALGQAPRGWVRVSGIYTDAPLSNVAIQGLLVTRGSDGSNTPSASGYWHQELHLSSSLKFIRFNSNATGWTPWQTVITGDTQGNLVLAGNLTVQGTLSASNISGSTVSSSGNYVSYVAMQGGRAAQSLDLNSYLDLYQTAFVTLSSSTNVPTGMSGANGYWFGMGAGNSTNTGFDLFGTSGQQLWFRDRQSGVWNRLATASDIQVQPSDLSALQAQIDSISANTSGQIDSLTSELTGGLAQVNTQLQSVSGTVDTLNAQVTAQVSSLQASVSAVSGTVAATNSQIASLSSSLNTAQTTLQANIDAANAATSAATATLDQSVQAANAATASASSTLQQAIANTNSTVTSVTSALSGLIGSNTAAIVSLSAAASATSGQLAQEINAVEAYARFLPDTTAAIPANSLIKSNGYATFVNTIVAIGGSVVHESFVRQNADSVLAQDITALSAVVSGNYQTLEANIQQVLTASASATGVLASEISSLTATVNSNYSSLQADINTVSAASSSSSAALAQEISNLTATVNSNYSSLDASILSASTATATATGVLTQEINSLSATVSGNYSSLQASISGLTSATSTATGALAQEINNLSTTVNNNYASLNAAITNLSAATSTATGALAQEINNLTTTVDSNYNALTASINTVSAASSTASSTLANEITSLTATVSNNYSTLSADITNASAATASATGVLASELSSLTTTVNNNQATLSNEITTLTNQQSATASQLTTLQTEFGLIVDYNVQAQGNSATEGAHGFFDKTGTLLFGGARSWNVVVLNSTDGSVVSTTSYDVYGSATNATQMTNDLNALTTDKTVVVFTFDEPQTNSAGIEAALINCGATSIMLSGIQFRGAYILVGQPGVGEGGGIERYAGSVANATNAWCQYNLQMVNGKPVGVAGSVTAPVLQASITTLATSTASATGALAQEINNLSATVNNNYNSLSSSITNVSAASSSASATLAQEISSLSTTVNNNYSSLSSSITNVSAASSSASATLAQEISNLSATVNNNYNSLSASISNVSAASSSASATLAQEISNLTTTVNNNYNSLNSSITNAETTAANANSTTATALSNLQSSLTNDPTNNTVVNPGFIPSGVGWSASMCLAASSSGAPSGAPSVYVLESSTRDVTAGQTALPVIPGDVLDCEVWVASNAAVTVGTGMMLAVYNSAGAIVGWPGVAYTNNLAAGVWTKLTGSYTVPTGIYAAIADLQINQAASGGSNTVYFSSPVIRKRSGEITALDASITNLSSATATATGSLATQINSLTATVNNNYNSLNASITTLSTATATATGSLATQITNVQSSLNGSIANVQTQVTTNANSITGLNAQYTLSVDASGNVAGIKLAASATTSSFNIIASTLTFSEPASGITTGVPLLTVGTINNQAVLGFAGALLAATGTFAGSLTAATGTFAGSLTAATGTFAGSLSAATGTFTGQVHGGSLATGAFTGYAWPATGAGGGSYIDSNGLLLGNHNTWAAGGGGGYFQITSTGNIYAPGFSIVNGTMTLPGGVVATTNIVANAVSVLAAAQVTTPPNGTIITLSFTLAQAASVYILLTVRANGTPTTQSDGSGGWLQLDGSITLGGYVLGNLWGNCASVAAIVPSSSVGAGTHTVTAGFNPGALNNVSVNTASVVVIALAR